MIDALVFSLDSRMMVVLQGETISIWGVLRVIMESQNLIESVPISSRNWLVSALEVRFTRASHEWTGMEAAVSCWIRVFSRMRHTATIRTDNPGFSFV